MFIKTILLDVLNGLFILKKVHPYCYKHITDLTFQFQTYSNDILYRVYITKYYLPAY